MRIIRRFFYISLIARAGPGLPRLTRLESYIAFVIGSLLISFLKGGGVRSVLALAYVNPEPFKKGSVPSCVPSYPNSILLYNPQVTANYFFINDG